MRFGLMIIGDEILSGSHTDAHFQAVREMLSARGLRLGWVEYIADIPAEIIARLQSSFAGDVPVFVTGGIGATPDDHTRQAAAAALGVPIELNIEAARLIEALSQKRGDSLDSEIHLQRLQMAHFPQGAVIVPNPFNNIAGFQIKNHYFTPGFPVMAHPMIEWVLEAYYKDQFFKSNFTHRSCIVYELQESQLAPLMEQIERDFKGVKTYSLPKILLNETRRYIVELGVKAEGDAVDTIDKAWELLLSQVKNIGGQLM